jgi:hypothetical protein
MLLIKTDFVGGTAAWSGGFARLRPPLPEFTMFGGMMVNRLEIPHLCRIGRSIPRLAACNSPYNTALSSITNGNCPGPELRLVRR